MSVQIAVDNHFKTS